jgi:hypothetical protein
MQLLPTWSTFGCRTMTLERNSCCITIEKTIPRKPKKERKKEEKRKQKQMQHSTLSGSH